jgi:hypothetical protein
MKLPYLVPDQVDALMALEQMLPPDTMKFRRWFGDSQVVRTRSSRAEVFDDRPDDPLIVYHGTRSRKVFMAFHPTRPTERSEIGEITTRSKDPNTFYGPHFTDDPDIAVQFMNAAYSWTPKKFDDVPRVYPVYLSIQNPVAYESESDMHYDIARRAAEDGYKIPKDFVEDFIIPAVTSGELELSRYGIPLQFDVQDASDFRRLMLEGEFAATIYAFSIDTFLEHNIGEHMVKMVAAAKRRLIELGYDGIWYTNDGEGGNGWVPFHPSQIKSAIANDGTYGPSKDIRRNPKEKWRWRP